ncbi:MAG: hypothetical protein HKN28_06340 [Alphaproteobacteria bacterium]|nr:hypothetical protein [Alphaproteobacteria bacterium]
MVFAATYPIRRRLGAALLALALVLPSRSALAAGDLDTLDKGPAIGDAIPQQVAAIDQNDETRSLTSLIGKNGLIVLFSRSFDW